MEYLNAGDKAPDFSFNAENGDSVSLSDFTGKKVILYFYPKDDTPVAQPKRVTCATTIQNLPGVVTKSLVLVPMTTIHILNSGTNTNCHLNWLPIRIKVF